MNIRIRALSLFFIFVLMRTAAWAGATKITPEGIQFADETKQTTAASGGGCGCLGVYDGNDRFLGYWVEGGSGSLLVYDPNIPGVYYVDARYPPVVRVLSEVAMTFYASNDCTGEMYITGPNLLAISKMTLPDSSSFYFIEDTSVTPMPGTEIHSILGSLGECSPLDDLLKNIPWYFRIKAVNFAIASTTLAYPITIRPVK